MENTKEFTVLIVDDAPANLQVVGNVLKQNGIQSIAALGGQAALEIAVKKNIDLILLDISMPEIDGFEVCKRLKADPKTQAIPIIFLSARDRTQDLVQGFELGAVDYITKPFHQPELLQRVRTHLELKYSKDRVLSQNQELKTRNKEVTALLKGTKNILGKDDFKEKARKIYFSCKELIGAKAGFVALAKEDTILDNKMLFLDDGGLPCNVEPGLPLPIRGFRGEVYRKGKTFYDNDFANSPHAKLLPKGHIPLKNVLLAPLKNENQVVGLLGLALKPEDFTPNDAQIATAFAEYIAIALLNAQMFEKIKRSEEQYKTIFFDNHATNLLIDPKSGEIVEANTAACKYYGFSPAEMQGKNITEINVLAPEKTKQEMQQAKNKKRNHFLFKHKLKSGEIRHVEVYSKKMTFAGRELLHSIIFDIEDKVKAEKQVKKLSAAVMQSPATIVITDTRGRIEYANPTFSKTTGYSLAEARGKNPRILKSGHTKPAEYKKLWQNITSGKIWTGDFLNKRKDGSFFWENATIAPIRDKNGKITNFVAVKEDITERKQAEERLQQLNTELNAANEELNTINEKLHETNKLIKQERQQFLDLLDNIPELIYVADMQTYELLFVNQTLKKMVGYDATGKKCYKALQEKNQPCDFCTNPIIEKQEKPYFWELNNPIIQREFYIMDRTIRWHEGKKVRFELAVDITERKQAEKALEKSKRQFETIFENANIGTCLVSENGIMTKVNHPMCQIYGYSKEELIGKNVNELTHPDDQDLSPTFIKNALDGGQSKAEFEKRYFHKDGSVLHCQVSSSLVKEKDQSYFISHIKDITQQKQAEKALKISEEKYRLITENATDVIWILNVTQQKFSYVSPSVYQMRGYTPQEAMQQSIGEALTPESAEFVLTDTKKNIAEFVKAPETFTQKIFRHELRQPCKNGKIIWIETTTRYRYNSKKEIEVVGISRNIDQRKAMEAKILKQNQALSELNATKDKFFSIVAHDLKNPFNVILGLSELLKNKSRSRDPEKIQSYSESIHSASQQAYRLLENLLEWSRTQMGRKEFKPEKIVLLQAIEQSVFVLEAQAKAKNITLSYNAPGTLCIHADNNMLSSILRNLISNAIKFTPRNGKIHVKASPTGEKCHIAVSDTGVGMDKQTQEKLFRISEKITSAGTENETGTGLGLLLCKEFVEQHSGTISVESQPGKGSTFTFSLKTAPC